MFRIFLDLEMHPANKKHKKEKGFCQREIIEIGAVKYEGETEIDSFKEYVKPEFTDRILPKYRIMTGIEDRNLTYADKLETVLARFSAWCHTGDYAIYSWSDSDFWQIWTETMRKEIPDTEDTRYMLNHWSDFQNEFDQRFGMTQPTSLENALDMVGLGFSGRAHDALNDARSTGALYFGIQDQETYQLFRARIEEAMKPHSFTMGDLFNFGGIGEADPTA